jgi:hypothetical protein
LSGGPAKEAEKKKETESYHFLTSFLYVGSLKMRYMSFLFAGLFIPFEDDRSPSSSVTRTTQCGEYGCKGQNSGV